jgi:hypothetical protein
MPSQHLQPDTILDVQDIRSLPNRQNHPYRGSVRNSQLRPTKRRISVPAAERDTSQRGSSVHSTIQGQNSTPSSSLYNSRITDITQPGPSTLSATLRRTINTPTAMPDTSSRSTLERSGTIPPDSTRRLVSSPISIIASTPTSLSGLENLTAPIPNQEGPAIIANPLRLQATVRNPRHMQWHLQPQAVSTPRSTVSGSCSIHQFSH